MPLVTIDVRRGRPAEQLAAIGDCVHEAMTQELGAPERDRFQILTEHDPESFSFDRSYLDIDRSDEFVLVRLTLASGRTTEAKQAFYATLCDLLVDRIGLRPEDLSVCLTENAREDWSFGHGQASYVVLPRERWR